MSLRSPLKPAVSRVLPQGCAPLQQWSRFQRAGWPSRRFPTRWRASRSTVSSPGIPRAGLRLTSCIPTFFPRPERPGVLIRLFQPSRPPHTSRQYESADQRLLSGWSISGARLEMSCCGIKSEINLRSVQAQDPRRAMAGNRHGTGRSNGDNRSGANNRIR
jgi:hypothetical protein